MHSIECKCICTCKPKVFNPPIKTYKAGEPMIPEHCWNCHNYNCIQVSANGSGYWCRYCGYGGTVSYAVHDSK